MPLLDHDRLRALLGQDSPWSRECGERVRARREATTSWSVATAARTVGTTVQTLARVENGRIVPRDYLRAAIAYALQVEIDELWIPPSLAELERHAVDRGR